jgi:hypothetical protein
MKKRLWSCSLWNPDREQVLSWTSPGVGLMRTTFRSHQRFLKASLKSLGSFSHLTFRESRFPWSSVLMKESMWIWLHSQRTVLARQALSQSAQCWESTRKSQKFKCLSFATYVSCQPKSQKSTKR